MREMEDNVYYDLMPPANVLGETFPRVICEYQVPHHPNEYVVRGTPEGGTKEEPFVLRFTQKGKIKAFRSKEQEPKL